MASTAKAVRAKGGPAGSQAQPKKKGGLLIWIMAGVVAVVLLPTTLVLIPAMMPTIVARVVDPGPGRQLTVTVGALNLAGSLWFIHDLWSGGQSFGAIVPALTNIMAWLTALVGAGVGWGIYAIMPPIMRTIAVAKSAARASRIRKDQAALAELWGEPVRGGSATRS